VKEENRMSKKPHVMIVEGRFYDEIADLLLKGATAAVERAGGTYEVFSVPGALEIPAVIAMGAETGRFDAYVALGAVIRGETSHYDTVAGESARALMDMSIQMDLPIGNGIMTCENKEQVMVRVDPAQKDKGGAAVEAALAVLAIKNSLSEAQEG
jgi:6,7-dimethyl-8-ribityllumazine synthase